MKSKKITKFLGKEEELPKKENNSNEIEQIDEKNISQKDGLIERVDRKLVTQDGKQLLREQLHEKN